MFRYLLVAVPVIISLIILISQIIVPMFSDLRFFWWFRSSEPVTPNQSNQSNQTNLDTAVDEISVQLEDRVRKAKETLDIVDENIDKLKQAKTSSFNNLNQNKTKNDEQDQT
jgi:hypothetical protein